MKVTLRERTPSTQSIVQWCYRVDCCPVYFGKIQRPTEGSTPTAKFFLLLFNIMCNITFYDFSISLSILLFKIMCNITFLFYFTYSYWIHPTFIVILVYWWLVFIAVLLGTGVRIHSLYTSHVLFYCFYFYSVVIFIQSLAQEFPSGLIKFYLIFSVLILYFSLQWIYPALATFVISACTSGTYCWLQMISC